MERAGLVSRHRDPHDRRAHRVEVTERGDRLFQLLVEHAVAFDDQLRTGISVGEQQELRRRLLDRLRSNIVTPEA